MNYFELICIVTLAVSAAGQKPGKIIGGTNGNISDFYYQAFLTTNTNVCGGTIIGNTWVLTSAACVYQASYVTIRAGSVNKDSGGTVNNGYFVYIHPKYVPNSYEYNFGIIYAWPPFPTGSPGVGTAIMPWYEPLPTTRAVASGWGSISGLNGPMSNTLRSVTLAVTSRAMCQSIYKNVTISSSIICAGGTGMNICVGDGGGPLVDQRNGNLYGIASFTSGCSTDGTPAGFSNVANQRNWIYQVTGIA